ncbi:uncharacterized protein LOC141665402 [Apium graveolens]|uniref:uncharacterized protein LOC141665402 n=1 Tax=Apium graveolens TaxID=4045 RepID=UPI003D790941
MKYVVVDSRCPWCHSHLEFDTHVLFACDFARIVWYNSGIQQLVQVVPGEMEAMTIMRAFEIYTRERCVLLGMICWSLWNSRNNWVWEKANGSAFGVKASTLNLLQDWRASQVKESKISNQRISGTRIWTKPELGWFKMNVDVAVFQDGNTGVGNVLRDMHG